MRTDVDKARLRGHEKDLTDASALVTMGKVEPRKLRRLFEDVQPEIKRYPAIDASDFLARLSSFLEANEPG